MNTALHIVVTETHVEAMPAVRREVIHVSHIDGKLLPAFAAIAKQERRTGQLIVNFSCGNSVSAQWVEKIRD